MEGLIALLGGTVAASSHLTKTSTRAVANASPEPLSNWVLSFGEDLFVVGLAYLALQHPIAALVIAAILLALIIFFAAVIIRTVRRWLHGVSHRPEFTAVPLSARRGRDRLAVVTSHRLSAGDA